MKRGEVWLVALDPTVGTEIQKTRPCLIVSPDDMNSALRRVIIAPLTSRSHPAPFRVSLTFRGTPGLILLDQIRAVDRRRFIKRMGSAEMRALDRSLEVLMGMFGR